MEANDEFAIQKAKTTSYNSWSDAMKLSLKFNCHIYGKNLKHIGWQTGEYVIDKVKELFPGASEIMQRCRDYPRKMKIPMNL